MFMYSALIISVLLLLLRRPRRKSESVRNSPKKICCKVVDFGMLNTNDLARKPYMKEKLCLCQ